MKTTQNENEQTCIRAREARERRSKEPHSKRKTEEEVIISDGSEIKMAPRHIIWFWSRVRKTTSCWEWTGSKWANGYGRQMIAKKRRKAHRVSFLIHNGFLPSSKVVCHHCDNPSCVRPDHLFLGTPKENSDDMVAKKRHAFAERNGRSKLTSEQVIEIRSTGVSGRKGICSKLAKKFGVSLSTIYHVRSKETWNKLFSTNRSTPNASSNAPATCQLALDQRGRPLASIP